MQCSKTLPNGSNCKAHAMKDSRYCFTHNPASKAKRNAARRAGGKAKHGRQIKAISEIMGQDGEDRPRPTIDILRDLDRELQAVLRMEPSLSRARIVGYLAGQYAKLVTPADHEDRLKRLEEQEKKRNGELNDEFQE